MTDLVQLFAHVAEELDRQHRRKQQLEACALRKEWKKSDAKNLKSLGLPKACERRIERLTGKGRPKIKAYRSLSAKVGALLPLVQPSASQAERKKAFKAWRWYPHHVEALYRGEHELAKKRGDEDLSGVAERAVGKALAISASKVHSICGVIRRERKQDAGAADFPPETLGFLENWMQTGNRKDIT